jgi:histidinol dehydrogenase
MWVMKIIRTRKEVDTFLRRLAKRGEGVSPKIVKSTENILQAVRRRGDAALAQYTRKFDGHGRTRLTPAEVRKHATRADRSTVKALELSARRIRKFHLRQREKSWSWKEDGIRLGQIIRPLERVGIYVPGGTAAYPSTVLMNVIPAQVAGVQEIAITVPTPEGKINAAVMAAIALLGVEEVYPVGGAQAIAALAYGTKTIRKVDKIVGPGNVYVATAKRMVFGAVDIDLIAGPSEILVVADGTAESSFIAADLLSQAEHDELASSVLVTPSRSLAEEVRGELKGQLSGLPRSGVARKSLSAFGAIILVKDLREACAIVNRIAPEHLEVMTASPGKLLPELKNAGAIFLGKWTPEALGDYSAGPNHTLPTGGTARWASPLGVYDFLKRSSLLEFTQKGFRKLAGTVETIAGSEGLGAHAQAVRIRQKGSR